MTIVLTWDLQSCHTFLTLFLFVLNTVLLSFTMMALFVTIVTLLFAVFMFGWFVMYILILMHIFMYILIFILILLFILILILLLPVLRPPWHLLHPLHLPHILIHILINPKLQFQFPNKKFQHSILSQFPTNLSIPINSNTPQHPQKINHISRIMWFYITTMWWLFSLHQYLTLFRWMYRYQLTNRKKWIQFNKWH